MENKKETDSIKKNTPAKVQDRMAAINALKQKFVSTIVKVYINSLDKEVGFREITVSEQKKLSRIMIDNENRKDIVYDAQCAILQQTCLEEDFNIYNVSEFDRTKLLLILYQQNMSKPEITFTCPECKQENKYKLDFTKAIARLDEFDIEEKEFTYSNKNFNFIFKLAYPVVDRVSKFYQQYFAKNKAQKQVSQAALSQLNIEYVNLFIKSVSFKDDKNEDVVINFNDYSINEITDIISSFPQDVLYAENGILTYITNEYIAKINNVFEKKTCSLCGAEYNETMETSVESFF